ncbi:hypothetical protein [Flavobacterium sp.]|jgi:hypothetical protein|uniref:hypothetical protein n=1 Tax=Flavobacterium sp. TaxID=239 RepID=UPI0037BE9A80
MKALKTVVLFLALVYTGNSFGQTKEETITWLKEKFEKCLSLNGTVQVSINECQIRITDTDNDVNRYMEYSFAPSDVSGIYRGAIEFNAKTFYISGRMMGVDYDKYQDASKISDYFAGFTIENKEENIQVRIITALKHLATFCPKKKQTF